jgi:CheY-like chemotaxis protein
MTNDFAPRLLLVDDDPLALEAMRLTLEANGFMCHTAENGLEALTNLRQTLPDIVISDLRMPKMSGFELIPIIRRCYPQIPVIVSSAEPLYNSESELLPMSSYLQKGSYSSDELIATIFKVAPHLMGYPAR